MSWIRSAQRTPLLSTSGDTVEVVATSCQRRRREGRTPRGRRSATADIDEVAARVLRQRIGVRRARRAGRRPGCETIRTLSNIDVNAVNCVIGIDTLDSAGDSAAHRLRTRSDPEDHSKCDKERKECRSTAAPYLTHYRLIPVGTAEANTSAKETITGNTKL